MLNIENLKEQGFGNLFVLSNTSIIALAALIFFGLKLAFFVFLFGFPIFIIIYKNFNNSIDTFFIRQGLTSDSANKLAVTYFFAQGLVIGIMFGWKFGLSYFG